MLPSKPKSLATFIYRLYSTNEEEETNGDFIGFDAKRINIDDATTDRNIKHVLSSFISTSLKPSVFTRVFHYMNMTAESNISMVRYYPALMIHEFIIEFVLHIHLFSIMSLFVACLIINSKLMNPNLLFNFKLVSEESISAFQTIGQILFKFDSEFNIINVFAKYPTKDVILSIIALSRLQHASVYADKQNNKFDVAPCMPQDLQAHYDFRDKNSDLINDLAHYSIFATAAYGWKSRLALSGKLHFGDDNLLIERTGVMKCDIVATNWKSKIYSPSYFIVLDRKRQNLVLSIRGTLSPRDVRISEYY